MLLTGPGSGRAALHLPLDLVQVPADAVQRAVDVGAGEPPRLADLPDQQQRQGVACSAQLVDRGCTRALRSSRSTADHALCSRRRCATASTASSW